MTSLIVLFSLLVSLLQNPFGTPGVQSDPIRGQSFLPQGMNMIARGRFVAQTTAITVIPAFTPSNDGTYWVSTWVIVTTNGTQSFNVQTAYTSPEDSAGRNVVQPFIINGGNYVSNPSITAGTSPNSYLGWPMQFRAKGGNSISVVTIGTFTGGVVYTVESEIFTCTQCP